MRRIGPVFAALALAVVAVGFYGCGGDDKSSDGNGDTSNTDESASDHAEHKDHGPHDPAHEAKMEMMKEELAKLPPEDRASAEKQHMCPVSNEMLGTMGAPKKLDVKGQQVWICCKGCEEKMLKDPDTYLAKIKK